MRSSWPAAARSLTGATRALYSICIQLTGPCGRTQKLPSATMVFYVVDIKVTLYLLSGGYLVRAQPRLPIYLQLKYDQTPISPRCALPRLRTARRLLQSPAEESGRDRSE